MNEYDLDLGVFPKKFAPVCSLTKRFRYYVLYGGRFSTKSHSVAKWLISRALNKPCRILCTREIQKTIKDSVHRLLWDKVVELKVEHLFLKTDAEIRCVNGSFFSFRGLKSDPEGIKSAEGYDYCWIEEASNVSDDSWENIIPTIRKEGSEFYIVFNTRTENDEVYKRFVTRKREDTLAIKINYTDIPQDWIPQGIRDEIEYDKKNFPEKYKHIWLGEPTGYSGLIYPMYDDVKHIKDIDITSGYLARCNCYMAIDPHRRYYPAIKWYAVTPDSKVIVYNEYPTFEGMGKQYYSEIRNTKKFDISMERLAAIIKACDFSEFGAKIIYRIPDPRFVAENTEFMLELAKYGVTNWRVPPYERIETQRIKLQEQLEYDRQLPFNQFNCPAHYVCSWCKNSRHAYKYHSWVEDPEKEVESEELKDFIDLDRYFYSVVDGKYIDFTEQEKAKKSKRITQTADRFSDSLVNTSMV